MVVHSCEYTDHSPGIGAGFTFAVGCWWTGRVILGCAARWGSMMNDGNNTVNDRATLKIRWRLDVKHHGRWRVVLASEVVRERQMRIRSLVSGAFCA